MPFRAPMPAPPLPPQAINTVQTIAPPVATAPVAPIGAVMPPPQGSTLAPGELKGQRGVADMLLQGGMQPDTDVWSGLGGIAQVLAGGDLSRRANEKESDALAADTAAKNMTASREGQIMAAILSGQTPDPALVQSVMSDPNANRGSIMELLMPKPKDGFTLGKDEIRYDAEGNPVAAGPVGQPDKPNSVEEYEYATAHGYTGTYEQFKKDNNASTNIDINNAETADTAFAKGFGAENSKAFFERRSGAQDAALSLQASNEAKALLDEGIITGFGADWVVSADQALKRLGFNESDDASANTQAFIATRAQEVGRIIKLFGAGTGLSNADREFATQAAAGQVTLDEKALRRILEINDKAARNVIDQFNKDAARVPPGMSPFPLTVDMPPPYQAKEKPADWSSAPASDMGIGAPPQGDGPQPGSVEDGYRFKGGNPADPNNWEKVQ